MLTVFYINAGGKHLMHLGVNDPFINLILGTMMLLPLAGTSVDGRSMMRQVLISL